MQLLLLCRWLRSVREPAISFYVLHQIILHTTELTFLISLTHSLHNRILCVCAEPINPWNLIKMLLLIKANILGFDHCKHFSVYRMSEIWAGFGWETAVGTNINFILPCGSGLTHYPQPSNIKWIWEWQPVAQSFSWVEASVLFGSVQAWLQLAKVTTLPKSGLPECPCLRDCSHQPWPAHAHSRQMPVVFRTTKGGLEQRRAATRATRCF